MENSWEIGVEQPEISSSEARKMRSLLESDERNLQYELEREFDTFDYDLCESEIREIIIDVVEELQSANPNQWTEKQARKRVKKKIKAEKNKRLEKMISLYADHKRAEALADMRSRAIPSVEPEFESCVTHIEIKEDQP
jgi:uncharacterized protein YydD (DUF2326 family)